MKYILIENKSRNWLKFALLFVAVFFLGLLCGPNQLIACILTFGPPCIYQWHCKTLMLFYMLMIRVVRLAFFKPNFRNLASFEVVWPKKFYLAFWPHLKFVGLQNFFRPFGSFLALFRWNRFFCMKIFRFRQHICKICVVNAILDRRPRPDVSKIWGMRVSK